MGYLVHSHFLLNPRPEVTILEAVNGGSNESSDMGSVAHLECLVEVLHHPNPLACLLGKLGSLDL